MASRARSSRRFSCSRGDIAWPARGRLTVLDVTLSAYGADGVSPRKDA
jgi:hypothetical protein